MTQVDCRDFLHLRVEGRPALDVDCERFYMSYVDSEIEGGGDAFVDRFVRSLGEVSSVRLYRPFWLSCTKLHRRVSFVLEEFRSRGGIVEYR